MVFRVRSKNSGCPESSKGYIVIHQKETRRHAPQLPGSLNPIGGMEHLMSLFGKESGYQLPHPLIAIYDHDRFV